MTLPAFSLQHSRLSKLRIFDLNFSDFVFYWKIYTSTIILKVKISFVIQHNFAYFMLLLSHFFLKINEWQLTQKVGHRVHVILQIESWIRKYIFWEKKNRYIIKLHFKQLITRMQCVVKLNPGIDLTIQFSVTWHAVFQVHFRFSLQDGQVTPGEVMPQLIFFFNRMPMIHLL